MPGRFNAQVPLQPIQPSLSIVYIEGDWNEGKLLETTAPQWWSIGLLTSAVKDEMKYRRLKVPPSLTFTLEPGNIPIDAATTCSRLLQYTESLPTGAHSKIF